MNAQQQKANPHPKEYIIDKTILDEIEKGVDGEWGEGVFAKYWGGNAIRSRPHPTPVQQRIDAALKELQNKMITDRTLCEDMEVKTSGASATYYNARAACLENYIEAIALLRNSIEEVDSL